MPPRPNDTGASFEWRNDLATKKIVAIKIWQLNSGLTLNKLTKVQLIFSDQVTSPVLGSTADDADCTMTQIEIDGHVSEVSSRADNKGMPTKMEMRIADATKPMFQLTNQNNTFGYDRPIQDNH